MSEEKQETPPSAVKPVMPPSAPEPAKEALSPDKSGKSGARIGSLAVLLVIVLSLVWYLAADRYTPYTSQARVDGFVVGVAPKVAGIVTEVWVRENNELVEAGQKLFQIDPSQYEIALAKVQSDLETAERQVEASDAAIDAAQANLLAAKANFIKAEKDQNRLRSLREDDAGTISLRRLEVSEASLEQARAGVSAAEAGVRQAIEQMGGEDQSKNSTLKTARSAVDKAQRDLENTTVRAASNGVVTDLRAEVGQFANTGAPVMTLVALSNVWINASFTENNLGHIRAQTPVEVIFDVLPGRVFEGRIQSIGLGVEAGNTTAPGSLPTVSNNRDWLRQSQRFPVMITFDLTQDEALRDSLRIGGQVSVMAYSQESRLLKTLGEWYIRLQSWLSYAY
ncbi:MAG: multidrug resistance efflux pump [Yoonia sp.]|jgi:multidrug resistance efflux pump